MSKFQISRCGLTSDNIGAGIPFLFDGVCVGRLAMTDNLDNDTVYLVVGSEVDEGTLVELVERATRLSRSECSSDQKIIRYCKRMQPMRVPKYRDVHIGAVGKLSESELKLTPISRPVEPKHRLVDVAILRDEQ